MNDGQFVMPEIWIGCPIEVSVGKSRGPYSLGLVLRKKSRSADVVIFGEGALGMMFDCWHDDDPRIQTSGPDVWEDNTRGTWHLTQGEIERRRMMEKIGQFERRVLALEDAGRLAAEKAMLRPQQPAATEPRPAPLDTIKPRPGRGRPRTIPIPLSEIRPLSPTRPLAVATQASTDD